MQGSNQHDTQVHSKIEYTEDLRPVESESLVNDFLESRVLKEMLRLTWQMRVL